MSHVCGHVEFFCAGCGYPHVIRVEGDSRPKWGYNGNPDKPTFTPSILSRSRHPTGYSNDNPAPAGYAGPYTEDVCHSFVTDGRIQYLSDCTHALAGQTIDLPEYPAEWMWDEE